MPTPLHGDEEDAEFPASADDSTPFMLRNKMPTQLVAPDHKDEYRSSTNVDVYPHEPDSFLNDLGTSSSKNVQPYQTENATPPQQQPSSPSAEKGSYEANDGKGVLAACVDPDDTPTTTVVKTK